MFRWAGVLILIALVIYGLGVYTLSLGGLRVVCLIWNGLVWWLWWFWACGWGGWFAVGTFLDWLVDSFCDYCGVVLHFGLVWVSLCWVGLDGFAVGSWLILIAFGLF